MAVTRVSSTGFLGNLGSSIVGVPIGIGMFLLSFVVLFKNEGCTNWGDVARSSTPVASDTTGNDGDFISVTGTITTAETLGDPDFLNPGPWITIERVVEQFAWVENSSSESRDKIGGGTETTTTYTYQQQWTASPPDSSKFEDPTHRNQPMRYQAASFSAPTAHIGAWRVDVPQTRMPAGDTIPLETPSVTLLGDAASGTIAGNYVYLDGSPTNPDIGNHRISFRVLAQGQTVTGFGVAQGGVLTPHTVKKETFLRVIAGDRDTALSSLDLEDTMRRWGLRVLGFFLMWMGMQMVFGPLHAVAGILPIAKKASKFLIALVTFPIAAVLSTLTIIVSMILHSLIAIILIGVAAVVGFFFLWRRNEKAAAAAPGA